METIICSDTNHTLSISDKTTLNGLKFYPNPINDWINIEGLSKKNITKIELINNLGIISKKFDIEK